VRSSALIYFYVHMEIHLIRGVVNSPVNALLILPAVGAPFAVVFESAEVVLNIYSLNWSPIF
jgi:hypothetical protein